MGVERQMMEGREMGGQGGRGQDSGRNNMAPVGPVLELTRLPSVTPTAAFLRAVAGPGLAHNPPTAGRHPQPPTWQSMCSLPSAFFTMLAPLANFLPAARRGGEHRAIMGRRATQSGCTQLDCRQRCERQLASRKPQPQHFSSLNRSNMSQHQQPLSAPAHQTA